MGRTQETSPSRSKMKILLILTVFVAATFSQIQFGDSSSSSSSSSSSKASSDASSSQSSAASEDEDGVNTRFFGLFKPKPKPRPVSKPHCGSCCYASSSTSNHPHQSSNPYQSNSNHQSNSGGGCRCSTNHLIFKDEWGKTHGDCQSSDNTGRKWCYTTGWNSGCGDLVKSQRYSSNPWSYEACSGGGSIPNSFIRSGN